MLLRINFRKGASASISRHQVRGGQAHALLPCIKRWFKQRLAELRHISGDDAYDRYLAHHCQHHADEVALDRRAYYLAEQQRKWTGVKRCC